MTKYLVINGLVQTVILWISKNENIMIFFESFLFNIRFNTLGIQLKGINLHNGNGD